jgi:hypothetical protein
VSTINGVFFLFSPPGYASPIRGYHRVLEGPGGSPAVYGQEFVDFSFLG